MSGPAGGDPAYAGAGGPDLRSLRIDPSELQGGLRRRRVWLPILLVLILGIAGVLGFLSVRGGPVLATLTVPPPARPAGDVLLTATGYVVAQRKAAVGAKIAGILSAIEVEEGTRVSRGDVIARIESFDLEASVRNADARLAAARADLAAAQADQVEADRKVARFGALVREEVGDRASLEQAEAAADAGRARLTAFEGRIHAAKAEADYARAVLANALVVAPFDGVVLTKDADVGESVAPAVGGGGTTRGSMVTMADMQSLEVEADVSESNIAKLAIGMPAEIVLDAFPDRPFPAVVHQIVPTADRQRATVQVKVRFTGDREGVLPEMSSKVNFLAPGAATRPGPRNVISIPATAVRSAGSSATVLSVQDGVVSEVPVTLAREPAGGQAEVVSGLSGGEQILAAPPADLKAGDRVRVAPAAS